MSRRDPGAANGTVPTEPGRCGTCGRLETLHALSRAGLRGGFRAVGCPRYTAASNVVAFPGAGTPAPGPRPAPRADLDAVGDRYTALLEARETGPTSTVARLAATCADDVPALVREIAYVEALRVELAAEVDRLHAARLRGDGRLYWLTDAGAAALNEQGGQP